MILHTKFGLILTTPWPGEKKLFLKFAKIRNSRNSQNSVWKPNFFPRQAIPKIFFALHSHYTGNTPFRVWFDLENSLSRWKRIVFKIRINSQFANFAKFRMKTLFFPRQAIPKILFDLHSHYTGDTPHQVWFDLNNSLTRWKRPIFKISFSRKPKVPYEILTFFLGNSYQKFFLLYLFITLVIVHT